MICRIKYISHKNYMLQKRFLWIFWLNFFPAANFESEEFAENQLKYLLNQREFKKAAKHKYFLSSGAGIFSGNSIKEAKKKTKLKAFL